MKPAITMCALLALFPLSALSEEHPYQRYLPTIEESYNDCKQAIAYADDGDMEAYFKTDCSIIARTTVWTGIYTLWAVPAEPTLPKNATPEQLKAYEKSKIIADAQTSTIKNFWRRFCALETFDKTQPVDLQLAKRFVAMVDERRDDPKLRDIEKEKYLQSRFESPMVGVAGLGCKPDKKP